MTKFARKRNTIKPIRMKKAYLLIAFMALSLPLTAMADDSEREAIEEDLAAVQISVNGSQVHVTGAAGKTLEIYNILGVRVATVRIDTDDKALNLNLPRGCYILKVGDIVRKISLR